MKKKFLGMSVGPLILMGLFIMIVCYTNITYLTINQLENALRGTAVATLAAYNQNSGLYMEGENGEIWEGRNIKGEALECLGYSVTLRLCD